MGRLLYMLLALASVVFLGSECLQTRDHSLLSHTSPPTTPESRLFDPASTRMRPSSNFVPYVKHLRTDHIENTVPLLHAYPFQR
jgi:hypothetical protein